MGINAYEYVFPVIGGDTKQDTKLVYGTAFSIGAGCFLTAAHVIHNVKANEWSGVGYTDGKIGSIWQGVDIIDSETIDELDLGIIKASIPNPKILKWRLNELPMMGDIITVGYPYALDIERFTIGIRAFAGHVVSGRTFVGLSARPRVYELSFQCPRGLSGAPLLLKGNDPSIVGLIISNIVTEMQVFSDKEVITEGTENQQTTTITKGYESLHLGIAVQSNELVNLHSRILNCSLHNHLVNNGSLEYGFKTKR